MAEQKRILVTGSVGQIGSELAPALRSRYGAERVVASDLSAPSGGATADSAWERLDCMELQAIRSVMRRHDIGEIYHLAAVLSAIAESDPERAWRINIESLLNVLTAARELKARVFFPSSIAAFGPTSRLADGR